MWQKLTASAWAILTLGHGWILTARPRRPGTAGLCSLLPTRCRRSGSTSTLYF